MIQIDTITVGAFAMNSYLVYDSDSREAIFIDPGMEAERLIKRVEDLDLDIKLIINTHAHIDHAAEAGVVQKHFNTPFNLHQEEMPLLETLPDQGQMFGIEVNSIPSVTKYINEGDEINFGNTTGKILHTPGHSPGGISISFDGHVFVGDCLFLDSIGRTDLYKGNYEQLINSIKLKLLVLPESTIVYSGHGPTTTIGREKQYNPFLQ